ncbi:hypothetical protein E2C01_061886 [Portunus trituberculatus]|uniref:Uncharacterized protein n=1 Tax=Portunus trituberculatus TaxID=210409 RepID=A0A5B7HCF2_PORTR|nr:hypothetical protein [Portunus trituberculatus]
MYLTSTSSATSARLRTSMTLAFLFPGSVLPRALCNRSETQLPLPDSSRKSCLPRFLLVAWPWYS